VILANLNEVQAMPQEIELDAQAAFENISPRVASALEAVWRRQPEGSRIEDAAKDLKIHRTTLLRWFQDDLGMSPKQALQRLRLVRAQRLMQETDEALATVAMRSGYSSFQAMVRHFRQVFRATPAQIRARFVSRRADHPPGRTVPASGSATPNAPTIDHRVKKFPAPLPPTHALTDHRPLTTHR